MMNMRKLCAIILTVCLIFSLSACVEKPSDNSGDGVSTSTTDSFVPAKDNGENSELGKEYKEYADLALIESGFVTLGGDCFEYEEIDGGVKITKYEGEYEIFAVPDNIDGKSVVSIGREAFAANRWISAIILPDSVKNIESLAFYGCNNLCYIGLGAGEKTVENYAFSNCPSLYGIDLSSCKSIGIGSFFGCNSLNFIRLSFVGGSADENRFLGYIFGAETPSHNGELVPDSLRKIIFADDCTDIPALAFSNCKYLTSIEISDSVTSIGVRAFYKCRSLVNINTGNGVKTICDDAFFGCDNLRAVELGDAVESIGMQAFFGCTALESIDVSNVKTIGSYAFHNTLVEQTEE